MRDHIIVYLHDERHEVRGDEAFLSVAAWLRQRRRLTGTKVVCDEGDCGACTVLEGRPLAGSSRYGFRAINSCLRLMCQVDGCRLITVEGLRPEQGSLTKVQQALVDQHGSQCGYCTPGFVMAITALKLYQPGTERDEILRHMSGNLCRCTGYQAILQAIQQIPQGNDGIRSYLDDPFPPDQRPAGGMQLIGNQTRLFAPVSLTEALQYRADHPESRILAGATDLMPVKARGHELLSLQSIDSGNDLREEDGMLHVGFNVDLETLRRFCLKSIPAFASFLDQFASVQIRNVGTLAGNVINGSPIADTLPFLYVTGAELVLERAGGGKRTVPIKQFFTGYKSNVLSHEEILTAIRIPLPSSKDVLLLYKVARRRYLDVASFGAAFHLRLAQDGTLQKVRIAYGGVGPTVVHPRKACSWLEGQRPGVAVFREASRLAGLECSPISDVRGSAEWRRTLSRNIMQKALHDMSGGSPDP